MAVYVLLLLACCNYIQNNVLISLVRNNGRSCTPALSRTSCRLNLRRCGEVTDLPLICPPNVDDWILMPTSNNIPIAQLPRPLTPERWALLTCGGCSLLLVTEIDLGKHSVFLPQSRIPINYVRLSKGRSNLLHYSTISPWAPSSWIIWLDQRKRNGDNWSSGIWSWSPRKLRPGVLWWVFVTVTTRGDDVYICTSSPRSLLGSCTPPLRHTLSRLSLPLLVNMAPYTTCSKLAPVLYYCWLWTTQAWFAWGMSTFIHVPCRGIVLLFRFLLNRVMMLLEVVTWQ